MITTLAPSDVALLRQAGRPVQDALATLGIASALYGLDGACLHDTIQPDQPLADVCLHWPTCHQRAARLAVEDPDEADPTDALCPAGHLLAVAPLTRRRQPLGWLVCCLHALRYESTETLDRLCSRLGIDATLMVTQGLPDAVSGPRLQQAFAALLTLALENSRTSLEHSGELEALSSSLSQSYEELVLLHRISDRLRVTQEPETLFRELCTDLKNVLQAEKIVALWTASPETPGTIRASCTPDGPNLNHADCQLLWQRTRTEARQPSGILIDGAAGKPPVHEWPSPIRNLAAAPIRRGEKFMGVLAALNKCSKPDFDSVDAKLLLSVANETAVYLDNFRLYHDLQDLLLGALRALTSSIDAKDPYTCGHSERVALISRWLAERLDLPQNQVHNMYLAGLLHDIGKIGVSEAVLRKPGALTRQEFEQMARHPAIGATILGGIKQMEHVTPAVLTHHEHYDGTGYPQRLRGKAIPFTGRIIMLADSFDAMTSERTYRNALPFPTALAEIRRFSGTQFDPFLAEVFLNSDLDDLTRRLDALGRQPAFDPAAPVGAALAAASPHAP